MTPIYLALDAAAIAPSDAELAARLRVPRDRIPSEVSLLVSRLCAEATPAAVFAVGERSCIPRELLLLPELPSLSGDRIALFAITLGYGVDRLLEREKRKGSFDAFLLDGVASAMAEAAAEAVDRAIRARHPEIAFCRRFSPGYGGLPLSASTPLLALLSADRYLGIRRDESLLMHPTKTITAILGGTHESRSVQASCK